MSEDPAKNPKLLICTPTHSGSVTKEYTKSLLKLQRSLDEDGIESMLVIEEGSLLHSMRNMMASLILYLPNFSHVLFVDADMGFDPSVVRMLIDANVDVIGAVYPFKKLPLHYQLGESEPTESLGEWIGRHAEYAARGAPQKYTDEIYNFEAIGTGLMLISKSCLKKLKDENAVSKYKLHHSLPWFFGSEYYGFFDYTTVNEIAVGEDYAFCLRWSEMGGKIYGLVSKEVKHVGVNVVSGRYADHKSITQMGAKISASSSAGESQEAGSVSGL